MKDLISIICTSYNHAEFIRETIESIWHQDYKNIEIIVVDDGSKDETPKISKELAKQKLSHKIIITILNSTKLIALGYKIYLTISEDLKEWNKKQIQYFFN